MSATDKNWHALFAQMYEELHQLARRELRHRGSSLTLGPTTLLHEVFLNLESRKGLEFKDRARCIGYAARAMRGLIIDYARRRQALKRGGAFELTSLPADVPEVVAEAAELQRIGDAIDQLAEFDPRLAQVVDLKYFCGFTFNDIGALSGVSERTVKRDWEKARLFLNQCLRALGD